MSFPSPTRILVTYFTGLVLIGAYIAWDDTPVQEFDPVEADHVARMKEIDQKRRYATETGLLGGGAVPVQAYDNSSALWVNVGPNRIHD